MAVGIVALWLIIHLAWSAAPMPDWLRELSGLEQWPTGYAPPYISEQSHDLAAVPSIAMRVQGQCDVDLAGACSFDCEQCTAAEDIVTCDAITQSFDDGPTEATSMLLDALKDTGTRTTFFLIGFNAVEYPEVVARESDEGHLVSVHTWSHRFLPALSDEEVFAELQWGIWAINATTSQVPRYFRPPYGGVDNRIRNIASQLGLVTVLWDKDTNDWQLPAGVRSQDEIMAEVETWMGTGEDGQTKAQGLILEHDLYPANVELAEKIRNRIARDQYTVAQCANQRSYQKPAPNPEIPMPNQEEAVAGQEKPTASQEELVLNQENLVPNQEDPVHIQDPSTLNSENPVLSPDDLVQNEEGAVINPEQDQENPEVKHEEPLANQEEPEDKHEEPEVKLDDPEVKLDEPELQHEEPGLKHEEPLVSKEETLQPQEECAPPQEGSVLPPEESRAQDELASNPDEAVQEDLGFIKDRPDEIQEEADNQEESDNQEKSADNEEEVEDYQLEFEGNQEESDGHLENSIRDLEK